MMSLYTLFTFFITIELIISGPLQTNSLLKRLDRRRLDYFFDDLLNNHVYKRNKVIYNQYGEPTSAGRRAVVQKGVKLWPNGVIPYDMSNMKTEDQKVIRESMQRIMDDTSVVVSGKRKTCITFVPKTPKDTTYITFKYGNPGECSAHVGYWPGRINVVTLGQGCMYYNIIQHELMHVMGFSHEQKSPNRDQYVKVFIQNIDPNYLSQFEKYGTNDVVDLRIPYDVNSIMQYPSNAFQKSGATGPSMLAIDKNNPIPPYTMDRRLSSLDVVAVKRLYQCST